MRLHRTLAAAAVLLVGPMLVAGPAQATPATENKGWNPVLLSSEPLYDGSAVRLRYTEGITVVASAGAQVTFTGSGAAATLPDGRRVYDRSVQVADPQGVTSSSNAKQAAAYAAAGRSVYADALAAGFSPAAAKEEAQRQEGNLLAEPPILGSGCVYSEDSYPDSDYEWSGCYKFYDVQASDPDAWYGAGSGTARGWGTGVLGGGKELTKGFTEITWTGTGTDVVDAIEVSPQQDLPGANCNPLTISLGYKESISLSYTVQLCDDGWDVTWGRSNHKVEWHGGSAGGDDDLRVASGASTFRAPWTTSSVWLNYRIGWQYACFC